MSRWAVILAGGSGTRFWPLSTRRRPKQFLPLASGQPLLVDAVARLRDLVPLERVLIVTGQSLVAETRRLVPALPPENLLAEPRAASTAPALAWATAVAAERDPEASVLSLHADWYVDDPIAFCQTAAEALALAEQQDVLVTVGIVPTRAEVGYGYIVPGEPLGGRARRVARFVEKPDQRQAAELIRAGAWWNSGLFAWTQRRFFAETEAVARELAPHLGRLRTGDVQGFFEGVTPIPVDLSHFERSSRVAVLPASFGWDDVGTWAALRRVRTADAAGNVAVGPVHALDSRACVLWSAEGRLVVDGVEGLVVVRANGVTLVTTLERAQHLKQLLESLPADWRDLE